MLLFDMSLCSAFPAIIIPALTGLRNEQNKGELLTLTAVQSSWIGSLVYVCEPLGSILSVFITGMVKCALWNLVQNLSSFLFI